MWPFSRRSSASLDAAIDDAVKLAAEHWVSFEKYSGIPGNIHLRDRIPHFTAQFNPILMRRFPGFRSAPAELILLIVAQGIEQSGLVSRRRIEVQLGIVLPDRS